MPLDEEKDCPRCHAVMTTDEGCEPTEFCHHCAQAMLAEADVLEEYSGTDGRRQWAKHASTWLYPGDKVIVISTRKSAEKS